MKSHPDDCDCGREHGAALVFGLTRRWGRRRRARSLLTLAGVLLVLSVLVFAWLGFTG